MAFPGSQKGTVQIVVRFVAQNLIKKVHVSVIIFVKQIYQC